VADAPLPEFLTLCEKKELATLNLVGVVIHAIGNLNLNDHPTALRTLMHGLEKYMLADEAVNKFHRTQMKKENESNGNANRSAA
jgi:hypothetical protein